MDKLKNGLYKLCVDYVKTRMDAAAQAIHEAQQAVNDETKSSAGDKYETGREMMQQETDRNLTYLNETNKLMVALNKINPALKSQKAESGSVVFTNNGNFYIAISAGALTFDGKQYQVVSPASPIGLKLMNSMKGEEFVLNNRSYKVLEVL